MTRDQIIAALRAAGVADPTEDQITKAMAVTNASDEDALTKAMAGLREAFDREHAEENDLIAKAMEQSANAVDAITSGCDAILAEAKSSNEALAKGMTALIDEAKLQREEIKNLAEKLAALTDENQELRKAMDVPKEPRATTGATPVPAPGDGAPEGGQPAEMGAEDLINKCMTLQAELGYADEHNARQGQLSSAIVELNSGIPVPEVMRRYNLSNLKN